MPNGTNGIADSYENVLSPATFWRRGFIEFWCDSSSLNTPSPQRALMHRRRCRSCIPALERHPGQYPGRCPHSRQCEAGGRHAGIRNPHSPIAEFSIRHTGRVLFQRPGCHPICQENGEGQAIRGLARIGMHHRIGETGTHTKHLARCAAICFGIMAQIKADRFYRYAPALLEA